MRLGRHAITAILVVTLSACAPATVQNALGTPNVTPLVATPTGLNGVMGQSAAILTRQFGSPELDVREGEARKLQFAGAACVLDAYLYPSAQGREPIVTHVDARLPDGRDMDKASCVAALQAGRAQ
jgi:hypothetical protein